MIEIRSVKIPEELDTLVRTWNGTFLPQIHTTREILRGFLDYDPNFDPNLCLGAYHKDQLVGFLIGKRWRVPHHEMALDDANQWVRDAKWGIGAIGVLPEFQKQGIGRKLLQFFEHHAIENGAALIGIGREPGKHLFPGIPQFYEDTLEFFEKCGYSLTPIESAIDITGDISHILEVPEKNPKLWSKITANHAAGFHVIPFTPEWGDKTRQFLRQSFPGKWYWTANHVMTHPELPMDELQLLIHQSPSAQPNDSNSGNVIGMACVYRLAAAARGVPHLLHGQGRSDYGGLGPIGIAQTYRGSRGLGAMLLHYALCHLRKKGVRTVLIDWTSHGLLSRYYGPAGFSLYLTYFHIKKELDIGE
jgi:GNAT superfamily N-acetyltransferase